MLSTLLTWFPILLLIGAGYLEREREQTEARERSSFFSQETLCGRGILVYCSSQPVDSLSRGRSFRVQGKVRGHVDSQERLVSKENKLIPWERANIYSWHSPLSTSHCRKVLLGKLKWKGSWSKHQFWVFLHDFGPTHAEDAHALISHYWCLCCLFVVEPKQTLEIKRQ